jgi:hypothetical protein
MACDKNTICILLKAWHRWNESAMGMETNKNKLAPGIIDSFQSTEEHPLDILEPSALCLTNGAMTDLAM